MANKSIGNRQKKIVAPRKPSPARPIPARPVSRPRNSSLADVAHGAILQIPSPGGRGRQATPAG